MSVINISQYRHISTKLKDRGNSTTSIYESFKFGEMYAIYCRLISNLENIIQYENASKDRLINELPEVMRTENYPHGMMLSNNVGKCAEDIKRIYNDCQSDVERLLELTEISELKFEKQYIFEYSKDKTENTLVTGLNILQQYVS